MCHCVTAQDNQDDREALANDGVVDVTKYDNPLDTSICQMAK